MFQSLVGNKLKFVLELLYVFSSNNIVDCKCEVLVAWQVSKIVTQGLQLVF